MHCNSYPLPQTRQSYHSSRKWFLLHDHPFYMENLYEASHILSSLHKVFRTCPRKVQPELHHLFSLSQSALWMEEEDLSPVPSQGMHRFFLCLQPSVQPVHPAWSSVPVWLRSDGRRNLCIRILLPDLRLLHLSAPVFSEAELCHLCFPDILRTPLLWRSSIFFSFPNNLLIPYISSLFPSLFNVSVTCLRKSEFDHCIRLCIFIT